MKISGHAGYDTKGKDIVCAGVSALYHTLIQSMSRLASCKLEVREHGGDHELIVYAPSSEARLLIHSFLIGMQEIERVYPYCVSVK